MVAKLFTKPFGVAGDKTPIPNGTQVDGTVSYETGFGADYERQLGVDPAAKNIGRQTFNELMFDVTTSLQEMQAGFGTSVYSLTLAQALPGGGYPKGALIPRLAGDGFWLCTAAANTANPDTGGAGWLQIAAQGSFYAVDTGVANAYSCVFSPALVSRSEAQALTVRIKTTNTGPSTINDGIGTVPLVGAAQAALQDSEVVANGIAVLQWVSAISSYVVVYATGGKKQVAPASKSQHAVQLAQMAAVTGGMRNGKMSVAAASATATFTADEVAVKTALGGQSWLLSSFSKAINLATTGAGGMDTGAAPVSGYVALYAIYNPTTATSALLATNATAAMAAEVYGGVNMPAGYTASALVSVWATNSSSQFIIGSQMDRSVVFTPILLVQTTTNTGSATPLSAAPAVPKNATTCAGLVTGLFTGISSVVIYVGSDTSMSGQQGASGYGTSGNQTGGSFSGIQLKTSQGVYYAFAGTSCTLAIYISSYTF